jgi:NAD(P)-dependent dehydrogenase (short-subunit alcohol dehydrogenase family)
MPCDIKDIAALQAAVTRAGKELGDIAVLVNNAGNDTRHKWQDVTAEYWDDRIAVNLRHQFFTIQSVVPQMQRLGGGSIVNFGSISWKIGQGGMPAYSASKAAVHGLTRSVARDLGPSNIRVNTVLPGWVLTERQKTLWLTPEADRDRERAQCLKSGVQPVDLARMVLFLASDDSRMCTSQEFTVDGGWI